MRNNREFKSGFSTLEIITGLLVASPILLGLTGMVTTSLKQKANMQQMYQRAHADTTLRDWLEGIVADLDAHRFKILPKIHQSGKISYADNSLNSVSTSSNLKIRPDTQSSAISSLRIDLMSALKVTSNKAWANSVLQACLALPQNLKLADTRLILGISNENIFEFEILSTSKKNKNCYELKLKAGKSMILPSSTNSDLAFTKVLIPIISEYSLYLSKAGELRFLSHVLEQNIENQPLVSNFPRFILNSQLNSTNNLWQLGAKLKTSKEVDISILTSLPRMALPNLVLDLIS